MNEPISAALTSLLIGAGLDPATAATAAGVLLGSLLTLVILIVLEWAIGGKNKEANDKTFIFSAMLGIVISAILGWFPFWVPFVIFFVIVFFTLKPLGQGGPLG